MKPLNIRVIMKKVILMAALMLSSVAAFAQNAVGSISIQPKAGLSIANLTDANADAKLGLVFGAEAEYQVTDIFSLSGGLLYSMQGAKWKGTNITLPIFGNISTGDAKLNLGYINVPIIANVYVVKGLAVKLGVQPGFCVSKDNTKPNAVDVSIPVGLSYEYQNFVLDTRYNWGVSKVFKNSDSKNSVFQITVGYKFGI